MFMERLVTLEDLAKYPELRLKGVSLNQHFDFQYLEQQSQPLSQLSINAPDVPDNVHEHKWQQVKVEAPAKKAKKDAKKEAPVKNVSTVKKAALVQKAKEVPAKKAAKVVPVKKAVVKKAPPMKAGKKGKK